MQNLEYKYYFIFKWLLLSLCEEDDQFDSDYVHMALQDGTMQDNHIMGETNNYWSFVGNIVIIQWGY